MQFEFGIECGATTNTFLVKFQQFGQIIDCDDICILISVEYHLLLITRGVNGFGMRFGTRHLF